MSNDSIKQYKQDKLKTKLADLKKKQEELRKQIQEQAQVVFNDASKALFAEFPKLKAFGWRQYTPYFNDGETCEFSAHTGDPLIQFGDDEELDDFCFRDTERVPDGTKQEKNWRGVMQTVTIYKTVPRVNSPELIEKNEAYKSVQEFLSIFNDDDMEQMFGDHVRVTVTAQGATKEDYDHD